jgi:hypothetical protein
MGKMELMLGNYDKDCRQTIGLSGHILSIEWQDSKHERVG